MTIESNQSCRKMLLSSSCEIALGGRFKNVKIKLYVGDHTLVDLTVLYIQWLDLEMFFPMNFFWWFLLRGHSRTILAWLPLWQPWANIFIGEIPRWPPNDVLHICNIYLFHKTWSVIHVIRGFRGQGIHFWWYYVHMILS